MNPKYAFSSQNSIDFSYLACTNNQEHHPQTKLPTCNLGVDNGMSNVNQSGGSNVGQLSGYRPRGRPRGSKNKPKGNDLNKTLNVKSTILEIPHGFDVIEYLKEFAQSRNIFVNVLGGSGMVSQVAYSPLLSQYSLILSENLALISFTGAAGMISTLEPYGSCSFTAIFGTLNGSVIGGTIWRLVNLGPMLLTVLISENPEVVGVEYNTLPN